MELVGRGRRIEILLASIEKSYPNSFISSSHSSKRRAEQKYTEKSRKTESVILAFHSKDIVADIWRHREMGKTTLFNKNRTN